VVAGGRGAGHLLASAPGSELTVEQRWIPRPHGTICWEIEEGKINDTCACTVGRQVFRTAEISCRRRDRLS
jgi:hypothetical protein